MYRRREYKDFGSYWLLVVLSLPLIALWIIFGNQLRPTAGISGGGYLYVLLCQNFPVAGKEGVWICWCFLLLGMLPVQLLFRQHRILDGFSLWPLFCTLLTCCFYGCGYGFTPGVAAFPWMGMTLLRYADLLHRPEDPWISCELGCRMSIGSLFAPGLVYLLPLLLLQVSLHGHQRSRNLRAALLGSCCPYVIAGGCADLLDCFPAFVSTHYQGLYFAPTALPGHPALDLLCITGGIALICFITFVAESNRKLPMLRHWYGTLWLWWACLLLLGFFLPDGYYSLTFISGGILALLYTDFFAGNTSLLRRCIFGLLYTLPLLFFLGYQVLD